MLLHPIEIIWWSFIATMLHIECLLLTPFPILLYGLRLLLLIILVLLPSSQFHMLFTPSQSNLQIIYSNCRSNSLLLKMHWQSCTYSVSNLMIYARHATLPDCTPYSCISSITIINTIETFSDAPSSSDRCCPPYKLNSSD